MSDELKKQNEEANEDNAEQKANEEGSKSESKAGEGAPKEESKKADETGMSEADAKLLKEVMQKKDKIKEQQDTLETQQSTIEGLQEQLKKFDGLDLERVGNLIQEADKAEEKRLEDKGEWNRLKDRMAEQHAQELEKVKSELASEIEGLQAQLEQANVQTVELTVGNAFSSSQFIGEELVLTPSKARTVYGSHFEVQDGQVVAYDAPKGSAERTMLIDANGSPLAFDESMRKIIDSDADRDSLIRSKMKKGAGSNSNNSQDPGANASPVSGVDKIQAGLLNLKNK